MSLLTNLIAQEGLDWDYGSPRRSCNYIRSVDLVLYSVRFWEAMKLFSLRAIWVQPLVVLVWEQPCTSSCLCFPVSQQGNSRWLLKCLEVGPPLRQHLLMTPHPVHWLQWRERRPIWFHNLPSESNLASPLSSSMAQKLQTPTKP